MPLSARTFATVSKPLARTWHRVEDLSRLSGWAALALTPSMVMVPSDGNY